MMSWKEVFKSALISKQETRTSLPAEKDPNEKAGIWSIVKDFVGKDVSSFTVPSKRKIEISQ